MKTGLFDKNVRIKLASGASQINVKNEFLFIKYQNRLFRINAEANDKLLKILNLLKEPKKLTDLLDCLPEFRKKDVIDFLRKLNSLHLLDLNCNYEKNFTISPYTKIVKFTRHSNTRRDTEKLLSSRVLLIGKGILAKKIFMDLRAIGVNCNKITSSAILNRGTWQTRKSDRNYQSSANKLTLDNYGLIIAAEDYPNIRFFEIINKSCFEKKIPWLRVSFDDDIGYLGPFVIPMKSSCYNCCQLRLATNSWHYEYQLWRYKKFLPETKLNVSGLSVDALAAISCNEIIKYLAHKRPNSIDNLYVYDTRKMEITKHKLIQHPNCVYCRLTKVPRYTGLLSRSYHPEEGLSSQRVTAKSVLSTKELLQRLREIEDEKTGIVIRTQKYYEPNIFGIDFHHFYGAIGCYPIRYHTFKPISIKSEGNIMSPSPSGSGISPNDAKLHALMEMVERYSNMLIDESRLKWMTYNSLRNKAINPLELSLYSDTQYRKRDFRCSRYSPNSGTSMVRRP